MDCLKRRFIANKSRTIIMTYFKYNFVDLFVNKNIILAYFYRKDHRYVYKAVREVEEFKETKKNATILKKK